MISRCKPDKQLFRDRKGPLRSSNKAVLGNGLRERVESPLRRQKICFRDNLTESYFNGKTEENPQRRPKEANPSAGSGSLKASK